MPVALTACPPMRLDRSLGIDVERGLRAVGDDPVAYRTALARFGATYRQGLPTADLAGDQGDIAQALRDAAAACAAIGATGLAIEAVRVERSLGEFDSAGRVVEAERYGRRVARVAAQLVDEGIVPPR